MMSNFAEWQLSPPIAWIRCWISYQQSHWGEDDAADNYEDGDDDDNYDDDAAADDDDYDDVDEDEAEKHNSENQE